ncbi:MAG TPA: hypothetical protein VJ547_10475 [Candidatus Thermoplasmatota archaeon]|nr:hypothetical protein [Candidatus Thermoplasmatota archaeon]
MEPSEAVTWLMQMTREMTLEAQQWDYFALTWKAMGFSFDENLRKRVKTHGRMLGLFMNDLKKNVVPKGTRINVEDLSEWTAKFERLQKTHGQLIPLFKREAERFGTVFKDAGAGWSAVDE